MQADVNTLPSMEKLLGQHVKLKAVKKIGEGTFGEAFKGGNMVFKIVPMEGGLLVSLLILSWLPNHDVSRHTNVKARPS